MIAQLAEDGVDVLQVLRPEALKIRISSKDTSMNLRRNDQSTEFINT
jgi:hypothetical protein